MTREKDCICNPEENTGGEHSDDCPAWEPECTCYETFAGHQPGCAFHAMERAKHRRPTRGGKPVQVQPDYGKDDANLSPGVYAVAHNHLAGPAKTREAAMKALAGHLWDEGHVLPGEDVEAFFFVWPSIADRRGQPGAQ